MIKGICFITLFALSMPSFADPIVCNGVAIVAEEDQVFISPPSSFKVVGEGRLYFYSSPNKNCRKNDIFVIPGDQLAAYTEYKGWYSVFYVNPKTGKEAEGWVESKRLAFVGTLRPKD